MTAIQTATAGFTGAFLHYAGLLLLFVLPLFALGIAWGLFRTFGRPIASYFEPGGGGGDGSYQDYSSEEREYSDWSSSAEGSDDGGDGSFWNEPH